MKTKYEIGDTILVPYTIVGITCDQNLDTIKQRRDIFTKYRLLINNGNEKTRIFLSEEEVDKLKEQSDAYMARSIDYQEI